MKAKHNSPWAILGVEPGATQQEIKAAFRRLALSEHPDKGGTNASFAQINEAYNTLKNKKTIPVMSQPDVVLVNVKLTIEQQINGVNGIVTANKPGTDKELNIQAKIPAGARAGDKFKIVDSGKHYVINIQEKADSVFTRDGYSVIMYYKLDIITAMRGGTISITDPCDTQHELQVKPGTSQDILVIPNKGLYNRKKRQRGNIYVHVVTEIPVLTDENLESFIRQLGYNK